MRLNVGDPLVTLPLNEAASAAADKHKNIDRVEINFVKNLDICPPYLNTKSPGGERQISILFEGE